MNPVRDRLRPGLVPIYALMLGPLVSNIGNQIIALLAPRRPQQASCEPTPSLTHLARAPIFPRFFRLMGA